MQCFNLQISTQARWQGFGPRKTVALIMIPLLGGKLINWRYFSTSFIGHFKAIRLCQVRQTRKLKNILEHFLYLPFHSILIYRYEFKRLNGRDHVRERGNYLFPSITWFLMVPQATYTFCFVLIIWNIFILKVFCLHSVALIMIVLLEPPRSEGLS